MADQIGQRLPAIARRRQREMHFGTLVDPVDMAMAVKGDHAIGQRLECAHEAVERLRKRLLLPETDAHAAMQAGKGDLPGTTPARQRRIERPFEPVHQLTQVVEVPAEHQKQATGQRTQTPVEAKAQRDRRGDQAGERQRPPEGTFPHRIQAHRSNRAELLIQTGRRNGNPCRAPSGSGDRGRSLRAKRAGGGYVHRRSAPRRRCGRPTPGRATARACARVRRES
jgi:hypothetical protein